MYHKWLYIASEEPEYRWNKIGITGDISPSGRLRKFDESNPRTIVFSRLWLGLPNEIEIIERDILSKYRLVRRKEWIPRSVEELTNEIEERIRDYVVPVPKEYLPYKFYSYGKCPLMNQVKIADWNRDIFIKKIETFSSFFTYD